MNKRKKFWLWVLEKLMGWTAIFPTEELPKSVICVAPHTSNRDFPIGLIYYLAYGRMPHYLIKKEWFVFPLNIFFCLFGGVPVDRKQRDLSTVDQVIAILKQKQEYNIAVTPEGTRSRRSKWKTGFYRIAVGAGIPIELGVIDYKRKVVGLLEVFYPTGNMEADMQYIRSRYSAEMARFPEKFAPEEDE